MPASYVQNHVQQFEGRVRRGPLNAGLRSSPSRISSRRQRFVRQVHATHVDPRGMRCQESGNGGVFTLGLGEHKPIRPKPEGVANLRFGCFFLDAIGLSGFLDRHGHAMLNRATRRNIGTTLRMLRSELFGPSQSPGTCFKMSFSPVVGLWYAKIPSGSHLTEMLVLICSAFPR